MLLNNILRVHFSGADFDTLVPPAVVPAPVEIDHFFGVRQLNIGTSVFLDLSSFVNEHRNMFQITRADSQQKKAIPLAQYPTNTFITSHLNWPIQGGGGDRAEICAGRP